jgi:uncharacterized protein (UPF0335 family)
MNIDKKALKSIVDEIEASRARQKGETEHQREVMKRARAHQLDAKAIRIVLQRRAMGETRRDEQDYYVHSYEMALGGKKAAIEALEQGASIREAARAGGISTGAAGNLAKAVQKSSNVDSVNEQPFAPIADGEAAGVAIDAPAASGSPQSAGAVQPGSDGGSHDRISPVAAVTPRGGGIFCPECLEDEHAPDCPRLGAVASASERVATTHHDHGDGLDIPQFLRRSPA